MTSKPMFMPAPRPRLTEDEARRLIEGSADLGFGRTTGDARPAPSLPKPAPMPPSRQAETPPVKPVRKRPAEPRANARPNAGQTLRFDVLDDLWTALKLESVHRRVTVKYLLMEALAKAGYPVDLDSVPEDGRRLR